MGSHTTMNLHLHWCKFCGIPYDNWFTLTLVYILWDPIRQGIYTYTSVNFMWSHTTMNLLLHLCKFYGISYDNEFTVTMVYILCDLIRQW